MTEIFDAIIVGAGQAGPPMAGRLTQAGMKVAIVERNLFGRTCVNTGCTPTKTLVASAYAAYMARRSGRLWGDVGRRYGELHNNVSVKIANVHFAGTDLSQLRIYGRPGIVILVPGSLMERFTPMNNNVRRQAEAYRRRADEIRASAQQSSQTSVSRQALNQLAEGYERLAQSLDSMAKRIDYSVAPWLSLSSITDENPLGR